MRFIFVVADDLITVITYIHIARSVCTSDADFALRLFCFLSTCTINVYPGWLLLLQLFDSLSSPPCHNAVLTKTSNDFPGLSNLCR